MTDSQTLWIVLGVFLLFIVLIVVARSMVDSKKVAKMEQERRMLDK
jgi:hypothetical protein